MITLKQRIARIWSGNEWIRYAIHVIRYHPLTIPALPFWLLFEVICFCILKIKEEKVHERNDTKETEFQAP